MESRPKPEAAAPAEEDAAQPTLLDATDDPLELPDAPEFSETWRLPGRA